MTHPFTFGKRDRLCSHTLITLLFNKGRVMHEGPIKVFWANVADDFVNPVQMLVSIPRKSLKRAVNRNLMKRRMREAYRLNKPDFCESLIKLKKRCVVAFVYLGKQPIDYASLEPIIIVILRRLIRENEKSAG